MSSILDEVDRVLRLDAQLRLRPRRTKTGRCRNKATSRLYMAINRRRDWTCHICARVFHDLSEVTVDHIVPESERKHGERQVLDLACPKCNNARGNVPLLMYRMFQLFQSAYPTIAQDVVISQEELRRRRNRYHKRRYRAQYKQQCIPSANQGTV